MAALIGAACGGANDGSVDSAGSQSGSGSGSGAGNSTSTASGVDDTFGDGANQGSSGSSDPSGTGGPGSTGAGEACATQSSQAGFQQVYLAFAFDVSASMTASDVEWRRKDLKWDPVVVATKQFFVDPASEGFRASLTFFPGAQNATQACQPDIYLTPNVPMTPLPSPAFGTAIDTIEPEISTRDTWRTSTPTAFAVQGMVQFVEAQRQQNPGKYAIVLVTDGYPEGCGRGGFPGGGTMQGDNSLESVVQQVEAARAANISTFVIGVDSPQGEAGAPDSLTNLHQIAAAGGTGEAAMLNTGNPDETVAAFKTAIEKIRGAAVSCTIPIPPAPDGRTFDKQKVNVTYTSAATNTPTTLSYDQACAAAGTWRYDEPANPTAIILCDDTCAVVQADVEVSLGVDFTCEDVIQVPL
ncbi:vWA domain-containing protein [Sorangium sp. So ce375]|uniref:vWA domain-containing protein n=1 Tax=Sorangium sp. So ce375 TaxID=3133306 RepID=UPI003F5C1864